MRPDEPPRCGHASCSCAASAEHGGYCSPYCANVEQDAGPEDDGPGACSCGHASCRVVRPTGPEHTEVELSIGTGSAPRRPQPREESAPADSDEGEQR